MPTSLCSVYTNSYFNKWYNYTCLLPVNCLITATLGTTWCKHKSWAVVCELIGCVLCLGCFHYNEQCNSHGLHSVYPLNYLFTHHLLFLSQSLIFTSYITLMGIWDTFYPFHLRASDNPWFRTLGVVTLRNAQTFYCRILFNKNSETTFISFMAVALAV